MSLQNSRNRTENDYDAVIVGSGPNGLAAGITLAKAGCRTLIIEAKDHIGGGVRTQELTLPGFKHDVCSAIHPLALASPFFRSLDLGKHGLEWVYSPVPLAHPRLSESAILLHQNLADMQTSLGRDFPAWERLFAPFTKQWPQLMGDVLGPLAWPADPGQMLRLALRSLWPAEWLCQVGFREDRSRTLFAGLAAHSILPLNHWLTSGIGMMLGILAHGTAWPFPRGGAQSLSTALEKEFMSSGGHLQMGWPITHLDELPPSRVTLLDITPRQFLRLSGDRVRGLAKRRWSRYRYGPGVFKVDYALSAPIPWKDPDCTKAACLHLGADFAEISASERRMIGGDISSTPFVLLAQHSLFDSTRAPSGCHTAWAYCHVPHGFSGHARALIDLQIERFAPGFKDTILATHEMGPANWENYNANYIGGDINGGMQDLWQMWSRPIAQLDPYATPLPGVFLCSSSTPPGGGVHGMSGFHAAKSALKLLASH